MTENIYFHTTGISKKRTNLVRRTHAFNRINHFYQLFRNTLLHFKDTISTALLLKTQSKNKEILITLFLVANNLLLTILVQERKVNQIKEKPYEGPNC